jgi:6-phosphogluconolactonase
MTVPSSPTVSACGAALICFSLPISAGCAPAPSGSGSAGSRPVELAQAAPKPERPGAGAPERYWVYIGTYTAPGKSRGIYRSELDLATGKLSEPVLAAETENPSFLAIHPTHRFLYAVNEVANVQGSDGGVSAFSIDPKTGKLTFLNQQRSHGGGPCYITLDSTGRTALVANYGGGSIASLPIGPDGRLREAVSAIQHKGSSAHPSRQKEPHAHSINLDPANRLAFAADLGLDKILIYRFNPETGALSETPTGAGTVEPGSGLNR